MSSGAIRKSYVSIVEKDTGINAFEAGNGATFVTGPPTAPSLETLYIDPDAKELYFQNTAGDLCTVYLGEGFRFLLENLEGRIALEDGTGFLRD